MSRSTHSAGDRGAGWRRSLSASDGKNPSARPRSSALARGPAGASLVDSHSIERTRRARTDPQFRDATAARCDPAASRRAETSAATAWRRASAGRSTAAGHVRRELVRDRDPRAGALLPQAGATEARTLRSRVSRAGRAAVVFLLVLLFPRAGATARDLRGHVEARAVLLSGPRSVTEATDAPAGPL